MEISQRKKDYCLKASFFVIGFLTAVIIDGIRAGYKCMIYLILKLLSLEKNYGEITQVSNRLLNFIRGDG